MGPLLVDSYSYSVLTRLNTYIFEFATGVYFFIGENKELLDKPKYLL